MVVEGLFFSRTKEGLGVADVEIKARVKVVEAI